MKGIILAGGTGSRLWPNTLTVSKQLLPVYDKPLIYYPLATLMEAGINKVLIITTHVDSAGFKRLLGDGSQFGIQINYEIQENPEGLAQAFIIGEVFCDGGPAALILGDNLFHGIDFESNLNLELPFSGARVFSYQVASPSNYGVVFLDSKGAAVEVAEKPKNPKSNLAITGLYFFDSEVCEIAKKVKPSARGELEIISIIDHYLSAGKLKVTNLDRGTAWLDTGNPNSLHDAASYVRVIEERTGIKIGCLEEIAWRKGWISSAQLTATAEKYGVHNAYGTYLRKLITS